VAGGVLSVVQMAFDAGYVHPPGDDAAAIADFVGERAIGLSEHPGTWAAFLILPAGLVLASLVARPRPGAALVLLLIVVSMGVTASRAGWIATSVLLLVGAVLAGRRLGLRRALVAVPVVVAAVAAAAALAIGLGALQRAPDGWRSVGRDASTTFRVLMVKAELELGRRHLVRGIGLGNIGVALAELPPDSLRGKAASGEVVVIEPRPFADRHNVYLGLFAELGVLGPLLFAAVLVSAAVTLARIRGLVADRDRELVDGLLLALLGSAIVAAFAEADRQAFLWWVVSCALAIGAAMRAAARRRSARA